MQYIHAIISQKLTIARPHTSLCYFISFIKNTLAQVNFNLCNNKADQPPKSTPPHAQTRPKI